MFFRYLQRIGLAIGLFVTCAAQAAETPTPEQMWQVIQQQQRQIQELQAQLASTNVKVEETDQKVEVAGDMIEQASFSSASGAGSWTERTRIGGYGEMHYNNLDSKEELDFHRFVLFFNHDFNDRIELVSEL
ncbi:MAG: hypothetical protein OES37_09720, partial [Chromatiales bacterium]|nr:hypothetical protein [Chromatiales bacterium]